jgi:ribonucleoside-diphosphate reductase alpha chain
MQEFSEYIWSLKYQLKGKDGSVVDKDMQDSKIRVVKALASVEQNPNDWYEPFLDTLNYCIPAGRIMSNAGASDYKSAVSLINCTVSGKIDDDMGDIFGKLQEAALTLKAGCGIGYEFSTLRPEGAFVRGAGAETSGPLSFMDTFDSMCKTIMSAGGRRGAQMGTFDVTHPDILKFIKAKREDGRLRHFNLSALITDDFVESVNSNSDWSMKWGDEVINTVPANDIWDTIMKSTYDYAEPGFLLIDKINKCNNLWFDEHIRATNPSMPAGTLVHTRLGIFPIEQLQDKEFLVRSLDGKWAPAKCFLSGKDKNLLQLEFDGSRTVKSTPEHRWPVLNKNTGLIEKKFASELKVGDLLPLNHNKPLNIQGDLSYTEDEGFLLGVFTGDGWLTKRSDGSGYAMGFTICNDDLEVGHRLLAIINSLKTNDSFLLPDKESNSSSIQLTDINFINWFRQRFNVKPGTKKFPKVVWKSNDNFIRGFLDGLISSDGYARKRQFIYTTKDKNLASNIAKLLGFHGIKLSMQKQTSDVIVNGYTYNDYTVYRVSVRGSLNIAKLLTIIPNITCTRRKLALEEIFSQEVKKGRITDHYNVIKKIKPVAKADVWDISVYHTEHVFPIAWGYTGNCGEQPLPPYGSCLLGSIMLHKFVVNAFTDDAYFDFDKFRKCIRIFVRMLDNVVELAALPLPQQQAEIENKRRHGMGYMGLGSALAMMGIKYGSSQAIEFTEEVSKELAMTGFDEGVSLAIEKGMAPILEREFDAQDVRKYAELNGNTNLPSKLPKKLMGKDLLVMSHYFDPWRTDSRGKEILKRISEHGCRFTHHSSIAPTGTISASYGENCCIAKGTIIQTSSGSLPIEEVTTDMRVLRYDVASDSFIYDEIEFAGVTRKNTEVYELELDDGRKIRATYDHKFLVKVDEELRYERLIDILNNGYEIYEVVVQ